MPRHAPAHCCTIIDPRRHEMEDGHLWSVLQPDQSVLVWPFRQQGSPLPYWSEQLCRDCRWSHLLSVVIQWGWRWWGKRRRIGTMVSKVFCWCCSLRTTRLTSAPRTMWDGWLHIWRWIIIHISSFFTFSLVSLPFICREKQSRELTFDPRALFGKKNYVRD
jgi:hypothetical protein